MAMKKKVLLVVIALVLVACCFAACRNYDDMLDTINDALQADYSEVQINVITKIHGTELTGVYILTFEENDKVVVDYRYEELNEISIDGNNSFKHVVSGTVTLQNGVVVDGDESVYNVPLEFTGINFKQSFFDNIKVTKSSFQADVKTPTGFLGNSSFSAKNMHVNAFLDGKLLSRMDVNYVSDGAEVSLVYTFTA